MAAEEEAAVAEVAAVAAAAAAVAVAVAAVTVAGVAAVTVPDRDAPCPTGGLGCQPAVVMYPTV